MQTPIKDRTAPILVTGGTGTLGRHVVARLLDLGREVRVLSRHAPDAPEAGVDYVNADLATGEGTDAALGGIDTILHLAGTQKGDDEKARNLVSAAKRAKARHLVFISVVGADRIPIESGIDRGMFGYFAAKHAAERIVAESGVPWTILRATQFHELTLKTVEAMAKLPIVPVPAGWRFQPIDSAEVADRLVELAQGAPAGLVPPIGGPKDYAMSELVRSYLQAAGKRRPIVTLPLPGAGNRAFRDGANLAPEHAVGSRTWEDFLAEAVGSRARTATVASG